MDRLSIFRYIVKFLTRILTRTRVTGLENIPRQPESPLIFAANHASTYDPILMILHLPLPYRPIGPGDFKLLFPANWVVKWMGVVLINRGTADRDSIKKMSEILKAGENLALFPEGGTWEKKLEDVKPGVAYLSLTTGAQIVPVAIGGTYQVWGKILRLQRPHISLHFEPPLPPVQSLDRKSRQDDLRRASLDLMHIIYQHLPAAEQARYDLHARQIFSGRLEAPSFTHEEKFAVMAELVAKPNLFSPLYRNLKLPLRPFLDQDSFHPAADFEVAIRALLGAFRGDFKDYLPYRMGEEKTALALQELDQLLEAIQAQPDAKFRFRVAIALKEAGPG